MRIWHIILIVVAVIAATAQSAAAQNRTASQVVPKYDVAAEATFKGTIVDVSDRICPVSGGLGSHFVLKLSDGQSIEVHVGATKFVNAYDLALHKGEQVEVVGAKVKFEGVDTIFVREVRRGNEVLVFRDKKGTPIW